MVIARLYDSELDESLPSNYRRLLYEECIGCDQEGNNFDPSSAHPDPFVRSMAYWIMKDHVAALGTLLESNASSRQLERKCSDDNYTSNPSVFNFYNYLRTHPLLVRQHLATTAADKSQTVLLSGFSKGLAAASDKHVTYVDCITPVERRLYFMTAHAHFKSGCPALALEVLSKLPEVLDLTSDITKSHSADSINPMSPLGRGTLDAVTKKNLFDNNATDYDWSRPESSNVTAADTTPWGNSTIGNSAGGFDWSQPVTQMKDEELELKWDDDDDDDDANSGDGDTKSDSEIESKDKLLRGESLEKGPVSEKPGVGNDQQRAAQDSVGDIMAQQLKFVACLKILMEELSTLATGFEVDGGQLRYQLYVWLEKEVAVLRQLCYCGTTAGTTAGMGSDSKNQGKAGNTKHGQQLTN